MADKKAVLVQCAGEITNASEKFSKKALFAQSYVANEAEGFDVAESCLVSEIADKLAADKLFLNVCINDESEIDGILDAVDRQTTIVAIASNGVFFYGYGIAKGVELTRVVTTKDIVPTLSYVVNFPIPPQSTGAVIYQALKDPDFPAGEIAKLKLALERMESAMARENKDPWDKHDCA